MENHPSETSINAWKHTALGERRQIVDGSGGEVPAGVGFGASEVVLRQPLTELMGRIEADGYAAVRERRSEQVYDQAQVEKRLWALDALDTLLGEGGVAGLPEALENRARQLRVQLEDDNEKFCASVRFLVTQGERLNAVLPWLQPGAELRPGLGYDFRDEVVSGILGLREPEAVPLALEPEMVFYQPTPVRHIVDLAAESGLGRGDVLVDLGSGLGHVALLAALLTGCRSAGIEVESAYVASARECAEKLRMERVRFLEGDARTADLSEGTVFYLYTPFRGGLLLEMLERLRGVSRERPIRLATLGPCTGTVAEQNWLRPKRAPNGERITVFASC